MSQNDKQTGYRPHVVKTYDAISLSYFCYGSFAHVEKFIESFVSYAFFR